MESSNFRSGSLAAEPHGMKERREPSASWTTPIRGLSGPAKSLESSNSGARMSRTARSGTVRRHPTGMKLDDSNSGRRLRRKGLLYPIEARHLTLPHEDPRPAWCMCGHRVIAAGTWAFHDAAIRALLPGDSHHGRRFNGPIFSFRCFAEAEGNLRCRRDQSQDVARPMRQGPRAPSTCRTEVAMARDEDGVLVVTPKRRHR